MRNFSGLAILAVSFALSVQAFGSQTGLESDSGIRGPAYETILANLHALEAAHPDMAAGFSYGKSIDGRSLEMIRIGRPARTRIGKAVVISGTTHGDEYLNIEDRLPQAFLEMGNRMPNLQRYFAAGGVVYIIPILNPDGYTSRQRENRNGQDLNRDFPINMAGNRGFTQPETANLASFLGRELAANSLQLKVSLDYHCCIGALLYPWSFANPAPRPIPAQDLRRFQTIGSFMTQIFGNQYAVGQTPVVLGYDAVGTTKDYWYENYGTASFTFEGVYQQENGKFTQHLQFWESIFAYLNTQ